MIRAKGNLVGSLNVSERKVYPELENLELVPTEEKQVFLHEDTYGYDRVTLEPIPEEYIIPNGEIQISENGKIDISKFESANVNVYIPPVLQYKEVTPTKEIQDVIFDEGYDGLNQVTVNPIPDEYIIPAGVIDITDNGDIDVGNYKTAKVDVHIPPILQDKNVTPTKEIQDVIFDEGYEGLSKVTVNPIPDEYIVPNLGTKNINVNGIYNATDEGLDGYSSVEVSTSGDPELEASFISLLDDTLAANVTKLPNGITSLGNNAFYNRSRLSLTSLPEAITKIGSYTFYNCSNLSLTSLPEGITEMGSYAFYGCSKLSLTTLPKNLKSIAADLFYNCSSLKISSLPENIESIGDSAFRQCTEITVSHIPETVKNISGYAFYKCSNVTISKFPDSFTGTTIGSYMFSDCPKVTISSIPVSVTNISSNAFYRCRGLTEMTINGDVKTISNSAFGECTYLAKLVLPNVTAVPTLSNSNALANTRIASKVGYIYVPDELVSSLNLKQTGALTQLK